jgi:hypothetical protein
MNPLWLAVLAVSLLAAAAVRRRHQRSLVRLRGQWGAPIERIRRMDAMAASHVSRMAALGGASLDARTWADLGLDDVFASLDRTWSTLGQHALYHRLRTTPLGDHLEAFEALVSRMSADRASRERAHRALARLQDPNGYDIWWLARAGAIEGRPWYAVFPVLTASAIALAVLSVFTSSAVLPLVVVLILNVAVRYATDAQISTIANSVRQCAPLIAAAETLGFLSGDDIDPIVAPLRTDVHALARLKLISRWVNGNPLMLPVDADPVLVLVSDIVAAVYEYLNLAFLLDATGVYLVLGDLSRYGASLAGAAAAAGDVDAAISVASVRAGRTDWTRPDFRAAAAATELTELRHPLVHPTVPNSIAIGPGRGAIVTGSNMSGKSTFLRTVGVNAVLAQTIHTCCARQYRAPVFHVRSCIGRADDLVAGKSYYIVEVETLLELVRASDATAPHLFLLDELFRGTNAVERIAAGEAVLLELLRPRPGVRTPHVVLAATHDGELVDLVSESFDAYHFGDSVGAEGLTFDHRLEPGPATTRNALALLRMHGAPDTLLARADATAERLDRERGSTLVPR